MTEAPLVTMKEHVADGINVAREKAKILVDREDQRRKEESDSVLAAEQDRLNACKPLRDEITRLSQESIDRRRLLYEKKLELALAMCPLRPGDVFSTRGWQATGVFQVVQIIPDDEDAAKSDWAILCRKYNTLGRLGATVVKLQSRSMKQQFEIIPDTEIVP